MAPNTTASCLGRLRRGTGKLFRLIKVDPGRFYFPPLHPRTPGSWTRLISSILPGPLQLECASYWDRSTPERVVLPHRRSSFQLPKLPGASLVTRVCLFSGPSPIRMDLPSSQQSWASTTAGSLALNQWGPEYFLDAWLWPRSSEGEAQVMNSHSSNEERKKSEPAYPSQVMCTHHYCIIKDDLMLWF